MPRFVWGAAHHTISCSDGFLYGKESVIGLTMDDIKEALLHLVPADSVRLHRNCVQAGADKNIVFLPWSDYAIDPPAATENEPVSDSL